MDLAFWAVSVYLVVLALMNLEFSLIGYFKMKLIFKKFLHINTFPDLEKKVNRQSWESLKR